MSSFLVFDSKGGEVRGPKESINFCRTKFKNGLQVVMVLEREDSGLWIAYVMGEFVRSKA